MTRANRNSGRLWRIHLRLIRVIGVIVPRRLRADWRQEWEAELRHRERLLAEWDRLDWRNKLELLRRCLAAFWDALWLQPERWEDEMIQDLRFGVRMLLKSKGLTAVAVLSLALGIGANTAIFSLADALLWRGLPGANNDRLFTVMRGDGGGFSYLNYLDYRDRNQVLEGLALYDGGMTLAFGNGERSEVVQGECVTGNFFDVLGVPMARGRAFAPEEDRTPGAHPVVVVSYDFWRRRFGGDPQLVGKSLTFNNRSFTVIGVAAPGFVGVSVAIALDLGLLGYSEERGRQFHQQLVERLANVPGIRAVTTANCLPFGSGLQGIDFITIEGQPAPVDGQPIMVASQRIGLRYFETMEIPLLRGRSFTVADTASSERVVIVNQTLARNRWPNSKDIGAVVGRRIRIGDSQTAPWSVIVGVAGDVKYWSLGEAQREGMWTPLTQSYTGSFQAVARTTAEAPGVVSAIRREVAALDPNLPVQHIETLREQVDLYLWPARMSAGLVTALGGVGLLLAAIGLYGVMSYAVAQRTREIGIRMALGARGRDVLGAVIGQGMRLTLAGVAIGLAAAWALTRFLESLLYGVSARDPLTFVGVPLALAAVAWLACYIPARRATKVDPLVALRRE